MTSMPSQVGHRADTKGGVCHGTRISDEEAAKYTSALDERLLRGLRKPRVRVDSVGAVYLSGSILSGA